MDRLDVPTTSEQFIAWATAVVRSEAAASEQALADQPDEPPTAAYYLADLRTVLERLATGDIEDITYPLPAPSGPTYDLTAGVHNGDNGLYAQVDVAANSEHPCTVLAYVDPSSQDLIVEVDGASDATTSPGLRIYVDDAPVFGTGGQR